ncbi:MAG: YbaB/EbfC family nucleoid-associated protein [Micromonosporaceae bacterium]|nr:YbaB/EbfC family nucleoid-associated protein [Micromonosporaceae bacterium]
MDRPDRPERPNWSALQSIVGDLRKTIDNIDGIQQRMLRVTGTAWSDDRLIKAVVGPRGQLVDLEIDPRVYRNPNSKALSASIVATVRAAVQDAAGKVKEIYAESVPADLRAAQVGGMDMEKLIGSHDTELAEGVTGDE